MRWLAVLAIVLAAGEVAAKRIVISEPPIVSACPGATSWEGVQKCLAKEGKVVLERTLSNAKLVRVIQTEQGKAYDVGVYLYVQQRDGSWKVGGMFDGGQHYVVMGLASQTIGKHVGFEFEIGEIETSSFAPNGFDSVPALLFMRRTLFCSGDRYSCPDATTRCDLLIHGRTALTFQGRIDIVPNEVHVLGDRRMGGPVCTPEGRVFLNWPP